MRLHYWGQTGFQVENPVGATVHGIETVAGVDTIIVLQLGTSCEDRVIDADGIIVATPGQRINCVPHRAETMKVVFTLRPPALHPPQISCHDHEPPPPPLPQLVAPRAAPLGAAGGGWAPRFHPPPPPSPSPSPPAMARGTTMRSSPECTLHAIVTVKDLSQQGELTSASLNIQPVSWQGGRVVVVGVSGGRLDLDDDMMHATALPPTIDATGRIVLFSFRLQDEVPYSDPSVSVTIKGVALHLAQLTCLPPPVAITADGQLDGSPGTRDAPSSGRDDNNAVSGSSRAVAPLDMLASLNLSSSDITLVVLASVLTLYMLWAHRRTLFGRPGSVEGMQLHSAEPQTAYEDDVDDGLDEEMYDYPEEEDMRYSRAARPRGMEGGGIACIKGSGRPSGTGSRGRAFA